MASWRLCALLLVCVICVLVTEGESHRGGGGHRQHGRQSTGVGSAGGMTGGSVRGSGGRRGGGRQAGGMQQGSGHGAGMHHGNRRGGGGAGGGGRRRGGGGRRAGGRRRGTGIRWTGNNNRPLGGTDVNGPSPGGNSPFRGNRRRPFPRPNGHRGPGRHHGGRRPNAARRAQMAAVLKNSMNMFGVAVYRYMSSRQTGNFVFSPYSAYMGVSMVAMGASGAPKRQIMDSLGMPFATHQELKTYRDVLEPHVDTVNTTLDVVNTMFAGSGVVVNQRFENKLRMFYNTTVTQFEDEDPETSINTMVDSLTHSEIDDMMEVGSLSDVAHCILGINAVYYTGKWEQQFDNVRTPYTTSTDDGSAVTVMSNQGLYKTHHCASMGAHLVEIPYAGHRFTLVVILPDEGNALSDVEVMLAQHLNQTLSALEASTPVSVDVTIPKLVMDTDSSDKLKDTLVHMGVSRVFQSRRAKLRRLTRNRAAHIKEIKHRVVFDIDEEGAMSSEDLGMMSDSPSMTFTATRSFLFIMRDKVHGLNLLMGRYSGSGSSQPGVVDM